MKHRCYIHELAGCEEFTELYFYFIEFHPFIESLYYICEDCVNQIKPVHPAYLRWLAQNTDVLEVVHAEKEKNNVTLMEAENDFRK